MATATYTYDLKCNGNNVSQVKINGTDVKRVKVNGKDVIHKFVTYKTTATIKCFLRFNSLTARGSYYECGEWYSDVLGSGFFYVSYSADGDSLSDSGGSIPKVEVYFRRGNVLNTQISYHETFSQLDPTVNQQFKSFDVGPRRYFVTSINADRDDPFDADVFYDGYLDGSVLRTSWGDVNISASKYVTLTPGGTSMSTDILLGSISKTFTKTVQEY